MTMKFHDSFLHIWIKKDTVSRRKPYPVLLILRVQILVFYWHTTVFSFRNRENLFQLLGIDRFLLQQFLR